MNKAKGLQSRIPIKLAKKLKKAKAVLKIHDNLASSSPQILLPQMVYLDTIL